MKHGFDDLIGYNLIEIYRKIHLTVNKDLLEEVGITFPQYRVLSRLWLNEEMTQKELSELLTIAPATLTAMIVLLEKKGLVSRTGLEDDKRVKMIKLTDSGADIRSRGFEIITKYENETLNILPKEESELFLKWLKMFNDKLSI